MSILKISDDYINNNASWTPLKTVGAKLNEVIDSVNVINPGTGTGNFTTLNVTGLTTSGSVTSNGAVTAGNVNVNGILNLVKGTITQTGTITTTVALPIGSQAGVITTVNSTVAAGSSATFTVTSDITLSQSVPIVIASTQGTGIPLATILSVSNGSFQIKLFNIGSAAFNNTIIINVIIAV